MDLQKSEQFCTLLYDSLFRQEVVRFVPTLGTLPKSLVIAMTESAGKESDIMNVTHTFLRLGC